jgi:hypothetical protein
MFASWVESLMASIMILSKAWHGTRGLHRHGNDDIGVHACCHVQRERQSGLDHLHAALRYVLTMGSMH